MSAVALSRMIREGRSATLVRLLFVAVTAVLLLLPGVSPSIALAEESSARIVLEPSEGSVGTRVFVSGEGFDQETTILISFVTVDNIIDEVETDSAGRFGICLTVEELPVGIYWVWASGASYELNSPFTVEPELLLGESSGYVGDEVAIAGTGFAAEKGVDIFFNGDRVGSSETDERGTFTELSIEIAESYGGEITITAEDTDGNSDSASFSVEQSLTLFPESGPAGGEVTISGTGFGGDEKVTIYFDDDKVGESRTNGTGSFVNAAFRIPRSTNGDHVVKVCDLGENCATKAFAVMECLVFDPNSGPAGAEVQISGTGFRADSPVVLVFDGEEVAGYLTDGNGSFTGVFVVPLRPNGVYYNIKASDRRSVAQAEFTVTSGAHLSSDAGHIGMPLELKGVGFAPGQEVTVEYDNLEVAAATTTALGSFSAGFTVPASTHGEHKIVATDGIDTIRLTFTVESSPPPVPKPLVPPGRSETDGCPHFEWSSVEDSSGVTYTLEVARDADFAEPVFVKEGLGEPEYAVSKDDALARASKDAPYHWRVRAVDGASNASEWSTPRSFCVPFSFNMPSWAKLSLVGLGIVLFAFLLFWLARNTFRHGPEERFLQEAEDEAPSLS